jgi:KipI family sensor histidine kinase inhibitor
MTLAPSTRPVGERGLLVEVESNEAARTLFSFARAASGLDLQDVVPGHDTVLLVGRRRRPSLDQLAGWQTHRGGSAAPRLVELRVAYDGPDLPAVAASCGFSEEEVVRRHRRPLYTVGFMGFAPGFAYLIGGDPLVRPPRLDTPRTRVNAGALAIAGEYSAVYPTASPGGWQLIGRSAERLFDQRSATPSLLRPGDRVRFVCDAER